MKITELDLSKESLLDMLYPEGNGTDIFNQHQEKLIAEFTPKMKAHLEDLKLDEVFGALQTRDEVENYQITSVPEQFRRELAEYFDNNTESPVHAYFWFSAFVMKYAESAQHFINQKGLKRLQEIMTKPKIHVAH